MRTGSQTGPRLIWTLRRYHATQNTDGHEIIIDSASGLGLTPRLYANWDNFQPDTGLLDVLALNQWYWIALGGTGTSITLRTMLHGAGAWTSQTTTQVAIVGPTELTISDDGSGTRTFHCKQGYIGEWNVELTGAELLAQTASETPLITANLLSFKSGNGTTDLTVALTGSHGQPFINVGSVTLDSDGPSFGPVLTSGDNIQLPVVESTALATPVVEQVTVSAGVATIRVGNIDSAAQTLVIRRAADAGGTPSTTDRTETQFVIFADERAAGLKIVTIGNLLPGTKHHFLAWVYSPTDISAASAWVLATVGIDLTTSAIEGPDVATVTISQQAVIVAVATEIGDFALDNDGPIITIFAPTTVTDRDAPYNVTISATDVTGVATMSLTRNGVLVGSYDGPGPHTLVESVGFADNGTRNYVASAIDLGGNLTVAQTKVVTIAVLEADFAVVIAASAATVTAPGSVLIVAALAGVTSPVVEMAILQDGVQYGQGVTQSLYQKTVKFFTDEDNGSRAYQARVVLEDGTVGLSNTVIVFVNIPAGTLQQVITTGMAEIIEIPRRDTSRAIVFKLTNASTQLPLTGATPRVQIAKAGSSYEDPTGDVLELVRAGHYVYWPSAEDVNVDGSFSVSITATDAVPLAVIQCRVVTPYGKR